MLGFWVELLPLFVVRWLARGHCERLRVMRGPTVGGKWCTARPDVLIHDGNPLAVVRNDAAPAGEDAR